MASTFKKIVLLQGLYPISDFHFRTIKSLLAPRLKLNGSKQDEYDKIKLADLMAEKFKSDAGLGKLITLFKDIPGLESTADLLKKEKAKVLGKMKCKGKVKNTGKRRKQDESSTEQNTLITDGAFEPESVKDVSLSKSSSRMKKQETDCQTLLKKKKKKNSTKKTDDLGINMVKQNMGLIPETSTITTGLQSPHKPPPTSSSSSSTKEKKNTMTKIDDSIKILETGRPTTSALATGSCPQTLPKPSVTSLSSLHTPQMLPTPPNSEQSPQMPLATLSATRHTPQTSSRSLQNLQLPPATPCSSQQTPQIPPAKLSSSPQTPQMLTSISSGSLQTSQTRPVTPSYGLQTPEMAATPSSTVQIAWLCPATPSSSLRIPQTTLAASSSPQTPQKPPKTPSSRLQTQRPPKTPSNSLQTHQIPLPPSSSLQIPQKPPKTPSNSLQTPKIPLPPASSLQTPQVSPASSINLQTPQMLPETTSSDHLPTKMVRGECIFYEIEDNTGKMEVLVHGRLTNIYCEEGDKLHLTCFELASSMNSRQLRCLYHSHLKVIKAKKKQIQPLNSDSNVETLLES
ncbi:PREDICTED: gamma-interferon-inducible protein 16 isoform X1 [Chinchilla lanigera]|uniref:gamma-interferon-inducible protein 16 isoform X1 n=1 Tax=Chinchilla lanigera TaxID=34839 RepID=UPI0006960AD1|nr:PREDICTED: gamma-interferon-inducible protein 16 isoform X1 [Chinchilla lanigera]